MRHAEDDIQAAFFAWSRIDKSIPLLKWCFAIQNGKAMPWSPASRAAGVNLAAMRAKKQGLTKGVWDVFFPVPRGTFGGLFIEFKAGKNQLTLEQIAFRDDLQGLYKFAVCYSWTEAKEAVENYWRGK